MQTTCFLLLQRMGRNRCSRIWSFDVISGRHSKQIGVTKRIGYHSFRHGLAVMLRQQGVDLKTAQELLRHANSRITLEVYQQAVGEEKRVAQNLAFKGLLEGGSTQHPSAPSEVV